MNTKTNTSNPPPGCWVPGSEHYSKNKAAQELGRMAKGKPKSFTRQELERRTARLRANAHLRWAGHVKKGKVQKSRI